MLQAIHNGDEELNDVCLSSYTPTLGTLLRARRITKVSDHEVGKQCFVAIGQPSPYEGTPLPSVPKEIEIVAGRISEGVWFILLVGNAATVESAMPAKQLTYRQWVHFDTHSRLRLPCTMDRWYSRRSLKSNCKTFLSACHRRSTINRRRTRLYILLGRCSLLDFVRHWDDVG
ncbi:hypothetical protein BS17DRAFT_858453 [Gyrodon lividus]|nr:hypothetical protein BS17DRAFT_858453 [Gyrodon lividus]